MRNNLALLAPRHVHLLESQVIALGEDIAHIAGRAVGVDAALLNEEFMDGFPIAQDDDAGRADLETEDGAVFLCPLEESRKEVGQNDVSEQPLYPKN